MNRFVLSSCSSSKFGEKRRLFPSPFGRGRRRSRRVRVVRSVFSHQIPSPPAPLPKGEGSCRDPNLKLLSLAIGLLLALYPAGDARAEPSASSAVSQGASPASSKLEKGGEEDNSRNTEPRKTRSRSKRKSSAYTSWKRHLPFWPRKAYLLAELSLFITLGVLFAQILEVSGAVKIFAILAWPVIRLGRLGDAASAPLLMAVQSGAVANGMLVSSRDRGDLSDRQLYTAVLIVSCLSLFAHLPTYVIPIGSVLGAEATFALFAVRFAAIFVEIIAILLVSNFVVYRFTDSRVVETNGRDSDEESTDDESTQVHAKRRGKKKGFWATVWSRSWRTLRRLLIYLVPTYAIMAMLEYYGAFKALTEAVPGLCSFSFLPPQSTVIIPAQAMSLYNGAIAAAAYIDTGEITAKQAVLTILIGSLVTAPIRTMKHAMPTYVAILGPKAGPVMAISAQVLRSIFLIIFATVMWFVWI